MKKKLLSSVLAVALSAAMTAVSLPVSALTETPDELYTAVQPVFQTGAYDILLQDIPEPVYTDEIYTAPSQAEVAIQLGSYFGDNTYDFYKLLSSSQKTIYKQMLAALKSDPGAESCTVSGKNDTDIYRAFVALVMDCPEYVGLSSLQMSYSSYSSDSLVTFKYCAGQSAGSVAVNSYNMVQSEVTKLVNASSAYTTNYARLKYFAHYLCDKVTYNTKAAHGEVTGENCWNAYGALINGDGVCESYAEAFKLLCDAINVPCTLVVSNTHEWNAVYMDGAWYYVDVTWMDAYATTGMYYDDWFMTGTDFADDSAHVQSSQAVLGITGFLEYPTISAEPYDPEKAPPAPVQVPKPENVTATAGVNSATLSWSPVSGASRYAVAYYNGSSYTTLTDTCTSTSYTATGLTAGKTYQFIVQANVNGQWSPFTSADHVAVTPTGSTGGSTKPANVTATAGVNSAALSWSPVSGASRYAVAYYNGSSYTTLTDTCTSTSYTATGLTAGRTYQFLVQANVNGQWSPFTSADHVAVTPTGSTGGSTKPANVTATAGVNSATLSWSPVSGASRYAIAYYNGGSYTTLTLNCTGTSYTATGLTAGRTYQFLVQANVNGQWSPFTSADHVAVTPTGSTGGSTKPANVTATAGVNSATLSWSPVSGASRYAVAYYNGGSYTTLTLNCTGTSYTATGLTAGRTYQFLVQANVNGQWSPFTSADHVAVTPISGSTKPANVTATAGVNSAALSWSPVSGATRYAIAYYNGGSYTTLTLNCTGTSYTATGLTAGRTYQFLVQANVNGQWSPFTSADHVTVTPTSGSTKPANVTATAGVNSAALSWSPVSGATRYAIAYYNGGSYTTLTLNCTGTSYTATGLTAGRTYQFLVQANVNGQWSPYTPADHVAVTPISGSTKPANVTATAGVNSAALSWSPVSGASRYAIAYYENGSYITLTLNCTGTSYTAAGLTAGRTYRFLVQANVNGQWSPYTPADHVAVTPV